MGWLTDVTLRIITALLALAVTTAAPTCAAASVMVRLPLGITSSGTVVDPGTQGQEYVVVENVRLKNPSNVRPQAFRLREFQLIVGDKRYTPTPRPHLGAIDLSQDGILSPREVLTTNLSFLVPADAAHAVLEFLPENWYDSYGTRVLYCCT
jgi:hypothetical protein